MRLSDRYTSWFDGFDAQSAFEFYEAVRAHLPKAKFPGQSRRAGGLLEIADEFDTFVFDAYGVLNIGSTPIAGASQVVSTLRDRGKRVFVLTNGATFPFEQTLAKFENFGFDFRENEILSSRMAALDWIRAQEPARWGVVGRAQSGLEEFGTETRLLLDDRQDYEWAENILLLSSWDWNARRQTLLDAAFRARPRLVVVANPDVISPGEAGFATEPGFIAHLLKLRFGAEIVFHGKPFPSVFDLVMQRIGDGQDRSRIAMIGDTLHTDILGGAAQGWKTVLVSDYGLFAGHDVVQPIARSGIVPHFIVPGI